MSRDGNDKGAGEPIPLRSSPCPNCGKPLVHRYRPFCSLRCADVDLHRWLGGRYAIPAEEANEDDEAPAPQTGEEPNEE